MGRPRKDYGSEQARIEALKQVNRDRVKRHRDTKKAEAERVRNFVDNIELGEITKLEPPLPEELAKRIAERMRSAGPVYDDGIEYELPQIGDVETVKP